MEQLTYYADDDVAEWVEEVAEQSHRSKSQVVTLLLEDVIDEVDGKPIAVDRLKISVTKQ